MDDQKVSSGVSRIIMANEMSMRYLGSPLYVCISGGKDSSVLQRLAVESGIPCIFVHSLTTVDAPPTVYFIRKEFERLRSLGYRCEIRRPDLSMWRLIREKKMLPTRLARFCCEYFKERTVNTDLGDPAFIATGVRWSESVKRRSRGEFEVFTKDKSNKVILTNDNGADRALFEQCTLNGARVVNPIIDWDDSDVWGFIHGRGLPYNPLYDMGFKRVGCVGCPMSSRRDKEKAFRYWPGFRRAYLNACEQLLRDRKLIGAPSRFDTAQSWFDWWVSGLSIKDWASSYAKK